MTKQWITLEDEHGDTHHIPLETEGTTADVSKGFKWICIVLGVWGFCAMLFAWFLFSYCFGS